MIDVRYPRRIDASGNTVEEYHPLSMSIDLNIKPLSTATMSLPRSENIPARSYVELFTPFGSAGFFRARSPEDAYGDDITSVELEHAITEVGDYLVKAKYDEMMAANTAMQTVFSHYAGGRWQLGSVTALGTGQIALSANYDRVLDVMLSILEQKPNCYLAFNFSTTPWTVSVATKDSMVSAEGRLSRNVDSAKVIYDDTELCTRAYYEQKTTTDSTAGMNLDGIPTFDVNAYNSAGSYVLYNSKLYLLPNGHESGETWANTTSVVQNDIPSSEWTYLDADTLATYGLVERRVPTGSDLTAAEALKVAQEYLRTHKEPKVSVRVQGEELSSTTGEPLDAFTIGKLLRLALVDYDVTVERNITGVSWSDVISEPEAMEVLLGDEEDTAIKFIHDVDAKGSSGGSGGGGKKKQEEKWKEYYTEYERDDYHYRLVAKHVDEANKILQQAGMYINSDGVLLYAEDNEKNVGSKLKVESDRISLVVEGTGEDAVVKRAAIQAAVVDENGVLVSEVTVDADNVYIGNEKSTTVIAGKCTLSDVTADVIKSRLATATGVSCIDFSAMTGGFTNLSASSGLIVAQQSHNVYNITVSQDGKTLNIYRHTGGAITFSKTAVDESSKRMLGSGEWVTPAVGNAHSGYWRGNRVAIALYDADGVRYNTGGVEVYLSGSWSGSLYEAGDTFYCYPQDNSGTAYYKLA